MKCWLKAFRILILWRLRIDAEIQAIHRVSQEVAEDGEHLKTQEKSMTSEDDTFLHPLHPYTLRQKKLVLQMRIEHVISNVRDLKASVSRIVSLNMDGKPMFL